MLTRCFLLVGVEYVGAAHGVADEREEAERQAEHERRQHGVAAPHATEHGTCFKEVAVETDWPVFATVSLEQE